MVQFTHDNSQIAPSCLISVSDGFVTAPPTNILITFDAAPVLGANQLTIAQGETVTITNSMLSATDQDYDLNALLFLASYISHGYFEFNSVRSNTTNAFTQTQIIAGNVSFTQDGSDFAPSYKIAVSDSIITTKYQPAVINFTPTPEAENTNTIKNSIISASVSGGIGLGIWLFKKYVDSKTNNEFGGTDLLNRVCLAIITRMKVELRRV